MLCWTNLLCTLLYYEIPDVSL
eukprot:COSAG06_NODE_55444_length_289_cov_1.094737_1_plen_21_part_10